MPRNKNKRANKTQKQQNFNSNAMPKTRAKAPTKPQEQPYAIALYKAPLFPATIKQYGQLYYDHALGLTAPVSGNAVSYFFTANGMFDPDITGTGHQPMGFDQMMLLYNQCTVVHSSITVTFYGNGLACRCAVALYPSASALTSADQIMENGLVKSVAVNMQGTNTAINNKLQSVTLDCDVKKYFARPSDQAVVDDSLLATTVASNPTEQVYYGISVWQLDPDGSTTSSIGFDVLLNYDAIYWEPKKIASS